MSGWKKLFKKKACKFLLFLLLFWGAKWFSDLKTEKFRFYEILSSMPNQARWETPSLSNEQLKLLDQPFTFLGKGDQSYAFLGEDKKTVLKFFRHDHLSPRKFVRMLPLPTSLDKLRNQFLSWRSRYDLTPLFDSAKLAFDELQRETGLIALHLNKSENLQKNVQLFDKIGVRHTIDLNETEFVLQKFAEPIFDVLDQAMQKGDLEKAKKLLSSVFSLMHFQHHKGIKNSDHAFKRNFGVVEDRAVSMDIGSYYRDPSVLEPNTDLEETQKTTERLHRWLKKHHPELVFFYEENLKTSQNPAKKKRT
jgi:hypothetical protein